MDKNVSLLYIFLGHGALLSTGILYSRLKLFNFYPTFFLKKKPKYSLTQRQATILKLLELVVKNDLHAVVGYFV